LHKIFDSHLQPTIFTIHDLYELI